MTEHLNHLNEEQIAAAMIEDDAAVASHLRECGACAAKVESLQATLKDFGGFVHANAERTNTFWWRQRSAAAPQRTVHGIRWAAAVAAVAIAVGGSLTLVHHVGDKQQPERVQVTPAQQRAISDEALLSEVQNDVQREYADAFAPVQTNAESAVAIQVHAKASAKKGNKSR